MHGLLHAPPFVLVGLRRHGTRHRRHDERIERHGAAVRKRALDRERCFATRESWEVALERAREIDGLELDGGDDITGDERHLGLGSGHLGQHSLDHEALRARLDPYAESPLWRQGRSGAFTRRPDAQVARVEVAEEAVRDVIELGTRARLVRQRVVALGECIPVKALHGRVVEALADRAGGLEELLAVELATINADRAVEISGLDLAAGEADRHGLAGRDRHSRIAGEVQPEHLSRTCELLRISAVELHRLQAVTGRDEDAIARRKHFEVALVAWCARNATHAQVGIVEIPGGHRRLLGFVLLGLVLLGVGICGLGCVGDGRSVGLGFRL